MLNSFATTVHTPRKCPGRDLPSSVLDNEVSATNVERSVRYTSSADGRNKRSTPAFRQNSSSPFSGRGYRLYSPPGSTWSGFTKLLTATSPRVPAASRGTRISSPCALGNAPIVGTSTRRFACGCACASAMVVRIFTPAALLPYLCNSSHQWHCHVERREA